MNVKITRFLIFPFFFLEIKKNKIISQKAIYCQNHPFKSIALGGDFGNSSLKNKEYNKQHLISVVMYPTAENAHEVVSTTGWPMGSALTRVTTPCELGFTLYKAQIRPCLEYGSHL